MYKAKQLLGNFIWSVFRVNKFRPNIIELNRPLIIYEHDKFVIMKSYKDKFVYKYFKNIYNELIKLLKTLCDFIVYMIAYLIGELIEIIVAICEFLIEIFNNILDLIFKTFAFLPVLIIKDNEKLVIDMEFKEGK